MDISTYTYTYSHSKAAESLCIYMWSVNKAMEMASHGGEETADGGGERKREKERESVLGKKVERSGWGPEKLRILVRKCEVAK